MHDLHSFHCCATLDKLGAIRRADPSKDAVKTHVLAVVPGGFFESKATLSAESVATLVVIFLTTIEFNKSPRQKSRPRNSFHEILHVRYRFRAKRCTFWTMHLCNAVSPRKNFGLCYN